MKNNWLRVSKSGLAKQIADRGKGFVLFELVQNAWDTGAKLVQVELTKVPGRPLATVKVTDDDPNGFSNLEHAYTLFAESEKAADPTKRGFMNLGEKLVLALCNEASVVSTTGSVEFRRDGEMKRGRRKTKSGSVFIGEIPMTHTEFKEAIEAFWTLIPPDGCETFLNGDKLDRRELVAEFEVDGLETRIADAEGFMRRSKRKATVQVFEVGEDETASIYEMGIPVVETGDKYHVSVMQKVPVNPARDNVPPSFLRRLRAEVLNHMASMLTKDESGESWVTNAMEDDAVEDEAVVKTVEKRFGKKRVIYDPSDPESNARAMAAGHSVMYGGSLSSRAWDAVRRSNAAESAGRKFASPKLYSDDEDAPVREQIARDDLTQGMREVEDITRWFCKELGISTDLLVMFVMPKGLDSRKVAATWSNGFEWNVTCLGRKWFDNWPEHFESMIDTIIHEFSHDDVGNHFDERFHKACTRNGASMVMLAMKNSHKMPHYKRLKAYLTSVEAA